MEEQKNNSLVPVSSNALSSLNNTISITNKILDELSKRDLIEVWNSFDDFWKQVLYANMICQNEPEAMEYEEYIDNSHLSDIIFYRTQNSIPDHIANEEILKIFEIERFVYNVIVDYSKTIDDLSPLQHFKEIKNLQLNSNFLKEIKLPSSLKKLKKICLFNNHNIDISGVMSLVYLEELDLSLCRINNIDCISNLSNLKIIHLTDNYISDIKPLSDLKELSELYISNNQIANISPLSGLENLSKLDLSNNRIIDFRPLSGSKNLLELDISNNGITNLTTFPALKKLQKLNIASNKIIDITPLSSLVELSELILYGNPLGLNDNKINDFTPLINLDSLSSITISSDRIPFLKPLSKMTNLNIINVSIVDDFDPEVLFEFKWLKKLKFYYLHSKIAESFNQFEGIFKTIKKFIPNCEIRFYGHLQDHSI